MQRVRNYLQFQPLPHVVLQLAHEHGQKNLPRPLVMKEGRPHHIQNTRDLRCDQSVRRNTIDHLQCVIPQEYWVVDIEEITEHGRYVLECTSLDDEELLVVRPHDGDDGVEEVVYGLCEVFTTHSWCRTL